MKQLSLETLQEPELVKVTPDGYFEFFLDEEMVYDFTPTDAGYSLRWVEHLSQKTWVTKQHLEQFARLAADRFGVGHV